ncbi:aminopeptidase [Terrihabitans soli]|uniref:Aminopeptidase n=1 Tax=Terrihabitans soli TaxID=708113 RepID=A0A6S6QR17_9HYPH|nr:aminopeptidase [Terrihabitans soli]
MHLLLLPPGSPALPIWPLAKGQDAAHLPEAARAWMTSVAYEPAPGRVLLVPGADGAILGVIFGVEPDDAPSRDPFLAANLARDLPAGAYRFEGKLADPRLSLVGFLLGTYRFDRYRKPDIRTVQIVLPDGVDPAEIFRIAEGVRLARDLVNTPANDMGPDELEAAARELCGRHGGWFVSVTGEELERGFPLIQAVGSSSPRAPRLIDFSWGEETHPRVTLVGKGVCFDTGGLDIKPDAAMLIMKKDMGGAANVLGLAHMIMDARLQVRLRVLIPAVENSVSGTSFRPGDVYRSRKGISVEIGNTDAEGRLVLADALALADEEAPDLLIDLATLTGAARVALGPELPPLFTDDDTLANDLMRIGFAENDPVWRLPLWQRYDRLLDSKIADMNNVASGGHAGSIIAALFLKRFVENAKAWAHLDIFAWTPSARPGRPEGGEAHAIRAIYGLLKERYGA